MSSDGDAIARWAAAHAVTVPAGRRAGSAGDSSPPQEPVPAVLAAFTEIRTWPTGGGGLCVSWDQEPDDGLILATCPTMGAQVTVWDAEAGVPVADGWARGDYVRALSWGRGPDGRKVLGVAHADGTAAIMDPGTDEVLRSLTTHTFSETSVAWGSRPGGRLLLATAEAADVVRVWDPDSGESSHAMYHYALAWGNRRDGRPVVATGARQTVRIWDPDSGETLHTLAGVIDARSKAWDFAWGRGPDGDPVLAVGERDADSFGRAGSLWIWAWGDRGSGHRVLDTATGPIFAMSWAPPVGGRMLLAATTIDSLRLWDGGTGELLHFQRLSFLHAGDDHLDWTLTPDGRLLLAGGDAQGQVHVWEVALEPPVVAPRGRTAAAPGAFPKPGPVGDRAIARQSGEEPARWLLRLGDAGLWVPLGLVADLVDLTGTQDPARLADLGAEEGVARLRALGWRPAARVAFAALVASRLAIPDGYAPPAGAAADSLAAALTRALAMGGGQDEPHHAYPVPARDLRAAIAAVTGQVVTLLRILGPAACAADPLLPVRLAHRIARLPDLSPRELRLLTAAGSWLSLDQRTGAAGTPRYTPGTVGLTRAGALTQLPSTQLALPADVMAMRLAENQLLYRQHRAFVPPTPQPVTIILDTTPPTFGPAGNALRLAAHLIATPLWEHGRCPHVITLAAPGTATELRSTVDLVTLWTSATLDQPAPALDEALALAAAIGEPVVFCTHHHTARDAYAVGPTRRLLSSHHTLERPPLRPVSPWHRHLPADPSQAELALAIGTLLVAPGQQPSLRAGQAVSQRQHPAQCGLELAMVEMVLAQRARQGGDRVLSLADVARRAQQQVHPGPGGQHATLGGCPEGRDRARLQRVGDRHAAKSQPSAQLPLDDRRRKPGGEVGVERRVHRPRGHDQPHPSGDGGPERHLVDAAQVPERHVQGDGAEVGVLRRGRGTEAGKVLAGRGNAKFLLRGDERGTAFGRDLRVRAVGTPELVIEVARLAVDVKNRREVEVHSDSGQVLPRPGARARGRRDGIGGRADLLFRLRRLARQPAHKTTLLVSHQEQRRAQRAGRVRLRELRDDRRDLSQAGDVLAEEDHPAGLARADLVEQARGRGGARVGEDHPLPGLLRRGQCERLAIGCGLCRPTEAKAADDRPRPHGQCAAPADRRFCNAHRAAFLLPSGRPIMTAT